jgi:hypothetical protein
VGAASGKLDALVFVVGLSVGIWAFAEIYEIIYDFAWSGPLGIQTLPGFLRLPWWLVATLVVLMALGLFWLASVLERKHWRSSHEAP